MPEDAGRKRFIKDFLQRVKAGEGFIEDIWIERVVRLPGSTGEGSTARSLSGRAVTNITELLEDDLKHCFDEGYFTFRFVAALVGSGKTSLLTYLHELTKTKLTYEGFSVVNRFQLSDLLTTGGSQSFSVKLYCYILAQTFWGLFNNPSQSIKTIAKKILSDYLSQNEVVQLTAANSFNSFRTKFSGFFAELEVGFEEFFFEVVDEVSRAEPRFTFVYLIDELDSLQDKPDKIQETRSLVKALIKGASQKFNLKIRVFIYLVGTSNNVESFISDDSVIKSLVGDSVINLNKGYSNEFELIRNKISERIEGAFNGYKNFPEAWKEIKDIPLNPAQSLREFCQCYATEVLKLHEKYFAEEPEKSFEGNARQLVESQCRQKWQSYLNQKSYTLSTVSTTTVLSGHAFDCYVELLHNGSCVARCFGEAKNYEVLSSHLRTLDQWLKDVKFDPSTDEGTPSDLAFMIAPSCPSLLLRKLEIKKIHFVQSHKVTESTKSENKELEDPLSTNLNMPNKAATTTALTETKSHGATIDKLRHSPPTNLNTAHKADIINALKGTKIRGATIDKLINSRPHQDLDELASALNLSPTMKDKIQERLNNRKICFT
jgi:hypothetical protein